MVTTVNIAVLKSKRYQFSRLIIVLFLLITCEIDTDDYVRHKLEEMRQEKDWYLGDEELMDKVKWVEASPKNFLEPSSGEYTIIIVQIISFFLVYFIKFSQFLFFEFLSFW
jgi:hypothetical protein